MEIEYIAINFFRDQTINEAVDKLIPHGYVFTSGHTRRLGKDHSQQIKDILRKKLMFDGEGASILLGSSFCKMEWKMMAGTYTTRLPRLVVSVDEFITNHLNFEYSLYRDRWNIS